MVVMLVVLTAAPAAGFFLRPSKEPTMAVLTVTLFDFGNFTLIDAYGNYFCAF